MKYPSIKMKVKKNLYHVLEGGQFLRMDGDAEVWSKPVLKWSTENSGENKDFIAINKMLAFSRYYYNIIHVKNDEEKRDAMMIVMNVYDSTSGKVIEEVRFHPYELNQLIKDDVIEII